MLKTIWYLLFLLSLTTVTYGRGRGGGNVEPLNGSNGGVVQSAGSQEYSSEGGPQGPQYEGGYIREPGYGNNFNEPPNGIGSYNPSDSQSESKNNINVNSG